MKRLPTLAFLLLLSGCGFVHDEVLVARYRLVAVDTDEEMSLCWSMRADDCVGDGLPGPTLFAAGFDDKYVVAAIHPSSNRTATQFFYVVRDPASENKDSGLPRHDVKGPFDQIEYDAERMRLSLPAFTRTFERLK